MNSWDEFQKYVENQVGRSVKKLSAGDVYVNLEEPDYFIVETDDGEKFRRIQIEPGTSPSSFLQSLFVHHILLRAEELSKKWVTKDGQ